MRRRKRRGLSAVLANLLILVFVVLAVYPLLWTFSTSLKARGEPYQNESLIPRDASFDNYARVWVDGNVVRYFINSVSLVVLAVTTHLVLSGLAAYAFARLDFPGKNVLFFYFLASLMVPHFVGLVPSYFLMKSLHIFNTYWSLYLPYSGIGIAISIYMIRVFLEKIPVELEEAARIDGAGDLRIFWQVMLPIARSALVTIAILRSLHVWGEFLWAYLVIQNDQLKTLPVALREFLARYPTRWEFTTAALIISVTPVLVAFALLQKQFVRGFVEGAIRG